MSPKDNPNSNASTTSFQSSATVTSTSPLSDTPKAPPKDYSAALATLQARYGTGGHLPTPKGGTRSTAMPPVAATPPNSTLTSTTALSSSVSESSNNTSAGDSVIVAKKKSFISTLKDKLKSG